MEKYQNKLHRLDKQLQEGLTYVWDQDAGELYVDEDHKENYLKQLHHFLEQYGQIPITGELKSIFESQPVYYQFKSDHFTHYVAMLGRSLFFGVILASEKLNHGKIMLIISEARKMF